MNGAWHTERNENIINFSFSMVTVLQLTQAAFSRKLSTFYHNCSCWTRKWQCLSFLIQRKRNGISLLKPSNSKRAGVLICFPALVQFPHTFLGKCFPPEKIFCCSKVWPEPSNHLQTRDLCDTDLTCTPYSKSQGNAQMSMSCISRVSDHRSRSHTANCPPCPLEGPTITFAYLISLSFLPNPLSRTPQAEA